MTMFPLVVALAAVPPPSPSPPRVTFVRAAAMLDVAAGRLVRDPHRGGVVYLRR